MMRMRSAMPHDSAAGDAFASRYGAFFPQPGREGKRECKEALDRIDGCAEAMALSIFEDIRRLAKN